MKGGRIDRQSILLNIMIKTKTQKTLALLSAITILGTSIPFNVLAEENLQNNDGTNKLEATLNTETKSIKYATNPETATDDEYVFFEDATFKTIMLNEIEKQPAIKDTNKQYKDEITVGEMRKIMAIDVNTDNVFSGEEISINSFKGMEYATNCKSIVFESTTNKLKTTYNLLPFRNLKTHNIHFKLIAKPLNKGLKDLKVPEVLVNSLSNIEIINPDIKTEYTVVGVEPNEIGQFKNYIVCEGQVGSCLETEGKLYDDFYKELTSNQNSEDKVFDNYKYIISGFVYRNNLTKTNMFSQKRSSLAAVDLSYNNIQDITTIEKDFKTAEINNQYLFFNAKDLNYNRETHTFDNPLKVENLDKLEIKKGKGAEQYLGNLQTPIFKNNKIKLSGLLEQLKAESPEEYKTLVNDPEALKEYRIYETIPGIIELEFNYSNLNYPVYNIEDMEHYINTVKKYNIDYGEDDAQTFLKESNSASQGIKYSGTMYIDMRDVLDNKNFTPQPKDLRVKVGSKPAPQNGIKNKKDMPDGPIYPTDYAWVTEPDTSKEGNIKAKILVTFPDGSQTEVETNIEIVAEEKFNPIIQAKDVEPEIVPWNGKIDLTNNIKAVTNGTKEDIKNVEDITEQKINTKTSGKYMGKVKITFVDGRTQEIEIPITVLPVESDNFNPEVISEEIFKGNTIDLTNNIKNLPKDATIKDITNPKIDVNKVGKHQGKVEITFKDGSIKEVEIPVIVKDILTPQPNPQPTPTPVPAPSSQGNGYIVGEIKIYEKGHLPETDKYRNTEAKDFWVFKIGDLTYKFINQTNDMEYTADVAPFIKDNKTFLPLRYVGHAINVDVSYNNKTRLATFKKNGETLEINIDTKQATKNGKPYKMEVTPLLKNDRLVAPVSVIGKAFNKTVSNINDKKNTDIIWNPETQEVVIYNYK